MRLTRKRIAILSAGLLALAALVFVLVVFGGLVDVAGTSRHSAPVQWALRTTMEHSIRAHAREVVVPAGLDLRDPALAQRAYGHYSVACTPCHGAPGVKAAPWMVINPEAQPLVDAADRWSDAELYWIIKNGVKMTGMPALGPTHKDADLWAISAFVRQLPTMTPAQYQAMAARHEADTRAHEAAGHAHPGM